MDTEAGAKWTSASCQRSRSSEAQNSKPWAKDRHSGRQHRPQATEKNHGGPGTLAAWKAMHTMGKGRDHI